MHELNKTNIIIESRWPSNTHKAYHAHVYFNKETSDIARELCDNAINNFNVNVGRFHKKLVGPHPMWSCQISFSTKDFDIFLPWLDNNRHSMSILVHALTGDNFLDHTKYAFWLGQSIKLDLEFFNK